MTNAEDGQTNHHPTKRLTAPDGSGADIDVLLVPLIEALWAARYETIGCCQDCGMGGDFGTPRIAAYWKGYALLLMPVADACRLVDAIKYTPQFQPRMHWLADGAWEMSAPLLPFMTSGLTEMLPWAQLRFPNDQVDDLVTVITSESVTTDPALA